MTWTPHLDEIDRAILERFAALGKVPLYLRDVCDAPETRALEPDEVLARVEILIAAGFIQRTDRFTVTPAGAELYAAAEGESGASEPDPVNGTEPIGLPHEPAPPESPREPQRVRARSLLSSTRRLA